MNSILRYVKISLIFIVGYAFWAAIGPLIFNSAWFSLWVNFYLNLPVWIQYIILFISGLSINKILIFAGDYNIHQEYQGYNDRVKYPPIRYAIFIGVSLLIYYKNIHVSIYFDHDLIFLYLGLGFSCLFTAILNIETIFNEIRTRYYNNVNAFIDSIIFDEFYDFINHELICCIIDPYKNSTEEKDINCWLQNECSITTANEDRYDRKIIVDKITNRLNENDSTLLRGQTIVGDYGSGKSSLLNLIEEKLIKSNKWIICRFDSWGRISDESQGQKLILEKIIEEISKHIGISDIQSIPKDYINALSGINGLSNSLIEIIKKTDLEPNIQLNKIDIILKSINKKLLVFIEDLDRNNNSEDLANSITPLLDRLVSTTNIHFIFTIGYDKHLSQTINRITNYRDDLSCNNLLVSELLLKFRNKCLKPKHNLIFLDNIQYLDEYSLSEDWSLQNRQKDVFDSVLFYLNNPRITKFCLRTIKESWDNYLSGEVNFDYLILLNIIKHFEPFAYDVIAKHINNKAYDITKEINDNNNKLKNYKHCIVLVEHLFKNNNEPEVKEKRKYKQIQLIIDGFIPNDYISEQKSINKLSNLLKEMNERNDEQEIIFSYKKYNQLSFLTKEENHFLLNHIHSKNKYEVYTKIALCYLEKDSHCDYKKFISTSGIYFEKEYFYQFQIISSEIFKLSPKCIFNFYNSILSKINSNDEIKSIIDKYFLLILKLPNETDLGYDLIFFINLTSMNKNVQDGIYDFLISGDFCNEKRMIINNIFNIEKNFKKSFSFTEAQIKKIKSICHNSNGYFMRNDLDIIDSYTP